MDIEEKFDILADLFCIYRRVGRMFDQFSQKMSSLQDEFLGDWTGSYQNQSKLMSYSNFVNALRTDKRNCSYIDYSETLTDLYDLERNLRTIILKITGFLPGYENKEEKFEPTTTNSDNSDLPSEHTSNSSKN